MSEWVCCVRVCVWVGVCARDARPALESDVHWRVLSFLFLSFQAGHWKRACKATGTNPGGVTHGRCLLQRPGKHSQAPAAGAERYSPEGTILARGTHSAEILCILFLHFWGAKLLCPLLSLGPALCHHAVSMRIQSSPAAGRCGVTRDTTSRLTCYRCPPVNIPYP